MVTAGILGGSMRQHWRLPDAAIGGRAGDHLAGSRSLRELLFRVLLVSLFALWRAASSAGARGGRRSPPRLPALIFSAFTTSAHTDRLALGSFLFRFLSGLAFSAVFILRGFGITA
jgi:hypothetical protein